MSRGPRKERTPEEYRELQARRLEKGQVRGGKEPVKSRHWQPKSGGSVIKKVGASQRWRTYDAPGPLTVRKAEEASE